MDPNALNTQQAQQIVAAMVPLLGIFFLVAAAIFILPLWVALKKAGLAPALSLIALVPTLGLIVVLYILAFARWKVVPAPLTGGYTPPSGYPPATGYTAQGAYTPAATTPVYPPSEPPAGV